RDPGRGPFLFAGGHVDQDTYDGAGPDALVQDADPEVLELHRVELRIVVRQSLAQRVVERADRTLALGRFDVARPFRPDLHGRLRERRLIVRDAFLDVDAVAVDVEERLRPAGGPPHQKVQGRVGNVERVPHGLAPLDLLD